MKPVILCSALALFLGVSGASAQTVFKSTMPDGKVIYGEKPAPGATKVDTLEPPPAKSGISGLTEQERARAESLGKQREMDARTAAAARSKADDARLLLKQAEAAREAGKEPLPNERIGIVGGGTRLTDAYHARQKSLEEAVANARKRLAETPGGK